MCQKKIMGIMSPVIILSLALVEQMVKPHLNY